MTIHITETVLRDANQSLIATRLPLERFERILPSMNKAGYYSVECWGGATFDACLRYLDEDPWQRLRVLREMMPDAKLQMLLRGQNLLGYKHYPDDVVRKFVRLSVQNGIDIIRIFDALNDLRNIAIAVDETIQCGAHAQGAIAYTISPVHTIEKYVELAREMEAMGVASIGIKDMAGVMSPQEAFELVSAIKSAVNLPVAVHTHCTTGLAYMTYLKAIEAGADIIDTATSAFSGGTSQPATETMIYALLQMGYEFDTDLKVLRKVSEFFKPLKAEYLADGLLEPTVLSTDTNALSYKIPGGMLSNLIAQLKAHNALERLDEVLSETPKVRKELGYPPLVTPISQMVGVQAVSNVLTGERYQNVSKEIISYLRGEYGQTPAPVDPDLREKLLEGTPDDNGGRRPELAIPLFEKTKEEMTEFDYSDEDLLSHIMFPQVAGKFFAARREKEEKKVHYTIEPID